MKQTKPFFIMVALSAASLFCGTPNPQVGSTPNVGANPCIVTPEPGWVNDSTYRVRSFGSSNEGGAMVKRRSQSQENALLCAQVAAAELMTGKSSKSIIMPDEARKRNIPTKISAYIRGGQIVGKSFDDDDACEILFEITGDKLKEKSGG